MKITTTFLSLEQMKLLTTKRLLAYKAKLLSYPDTPSWDEYCVPGDYAPELLLKADVSTMNKTMPEWRAAYANVKEVLATREHIKK